MLPYAEVRRALGLKERAFAKAVDEGRIPTEMVDGRRRITQTIEQVRAHYEATTQAQMKPDDDQVDAVGSSYKHSRARREAAQAALRELELRRREEELVPARDMEKEIAAMSAAARSKLLGLPAAAKERIPHLTVDDILVLDELVRKALEGLADEEESLDDDGP